MIGKGECDYKLPAIFCPVVAKTTPGYCILSCIYENINIILFHQVLRTGFILMTAGKQFLIGYVFKLYTAYSLYVKEIDQTNY